MDMVMPDATQTAEIVQPQQEGFKGKLVRLIEDKILHRINSKEPGDYIALRTEQLQRLMEKSSGDPDLQAQIARWQGQLSNLGPLSEKVTTQLDQRLPLILKAIAGKVPHPAAKAALLALSKIDQPYSRAMELAAKGYDRTQAAALQAAEEFQPQFDARTSFLDGAKIKAQALMRGFSLVLKPGGNA